MPRILKYAHRWDDMPIPLRKHLLHKARIMEPENVEEVVCAKPWNLLGPTRQQAVYPWLTKGYWPRCGHHKTQLEANGYCKACFPDKFGGFQHLVLWDEIKTAPLRESVLVWWSDGVDGFYAVATRYPDGWKDDATGTVLRRLPIKWCELPRVRFFHG